MKRKRKIGTVLLDVFESRINAKLQPKVKLDKWKSGPRDRTTKTVVDYCFLFQSR